MKKYLPLLFWVTITLMHIMLTAWLTSLNTIKLMEQRELELIENFSRLSESDEVQEAYDNQYPVK